MNKWVDDWERTAGKQLGIDDWVDGCECTAVDGGLGVDILEYTNGQTAGEMGGSV